MANREMFQQFFAEADTDGSGTLTLDELATVLKKNGFKFSDQEMKRMFREVDISGDGLISLDEYLEAMGQQPPKQHGLAAMRRAFVEFDKDGNGRIDKEELKSIFKDMGKYFSDKELATMMKDFDDDGSGDMDYNEFLKNVFGVDA